MNVPWLCLSLSRPTLGATASGSARRRSTGSPPARFACARPPLLPCDLTQSRLLRLCPGFGLVLARTYLPGSALLGLPRLPAMPRLAASLRHPWPSARLLLCRASSSPGAWSAGLGGGSLGPASSSLDLNPLFPPFLLLWFSCLCDDSFTDFCCLVFPHGEDAGIGCCGYLRRGSRLSVAVGRAWLCLWLYCCCCHTLRYTPPVLLLPLSLLLPFALWCCDYWCMCTLCAMDSSYGGGFSLSRHKNGGEKEGVLPCFFVLSSMVKNNILMN